MSFNAAWWNEFGDTSRPTAFRDRLDEVYRDLLPAEPGYRSSRSHVLDTDRWRDRLTAGGWFGDVAVDVIEWHQRLTADSARDCGRRSRTSPNSPQPTGKAS